MRMVHRYNHYVLLLFAIVLMALYSNCSSPKNNSIHDSFGLLSKASIQITEATINYQSNVLSFSGVCTLPSGNKGKIRGLLEKPVCTGCNPHSLNWLGSCNDGQFSFTGTIPHESLFVTSPQDIYVVRTTMSLINSSQENVGSPVKNFLVAQLEGVPTDLPMPIINQDLQVSDTVNVGDPYTMSVQASAPNGGTLTYIWLKDGLVVNGETTSGLTLISARLSDAGRYQVVIGITGGGVTFSRVFNFTVNPATTTIIHLGYLYQDDNGRFKHRMLIHNRGPAAPYAFTFMAPSGVEVDPAANATGTLSANSVTRFQLFNASSDLRDLVTDIRGGVSTSATFTATANPNNIDITTYLLEPTSGAPDVVNHRPVAPMPPSDVTTIHLGYLYQDDNGRFKHLC